MNESSTDSLLKELENLNQTLSTELRREVTPTTTITTTTSAISGENTSIITLAPSVSAFKLTEDNLSEFVLENAQKLIKNSLETVESLKYIVAGSADGDTMAGFASLIKSTSSVLDTLNSINIQKQKDKTAKELKMLDINGRKELNNNQKPNQTLNLIAPRESIMKMLEEMETKKQLIPIIDAEFEEITPKPPEIVKTP